MGDDDPSGTAVRDMLTGQAARWTGTAAELLAQVSPDVVTRGFPGGPRALSGQLRRLAPALRAAGTDVEFTKTERHRLIVLTPRSDDGILDGPSRPSKSSSRPS